MLGPTNNLILVFDNGLTIERFIRYTVIVGDHYFSVSNGPGVIFPVPITVMDANGYVQVDGTPLGTTSCVTGPGTDTGADVSYSYARVLDTQPGRRLIANQLAGFTTTYRAGSTPSESEVSPAAATASWTTLRSNGLIAVSALR